MEIGEKIKELRIERGLTQEELADRAETIERVYFTGGERSDLSTIATLEDIVISLGTDLTSFFSEKERPQVVFNREDYFVREDERHKSTIEWIVPNAQKNNMEPSE